MKCLNCQTETNNPKFCSSSCAARVNGKLHPKRKTQRKCIWCDSTVPTYRDARCKSCQEKYMATRYDYIQEMTIADYQSKKSLEGLHQSSKNVHIRSLGRNHFKDLLNKPCARCGYSKHVELCHIKPISSFPTTAKIKDVNSYENLIQLCPNCHWEFDNL